MRQLRQPRLAEIIAASLRDDILTGKLKEGDSLPRQEDLFTEFRVSLPAVREAMRILETEGLVEVRRGNVGGAVVHLPTAERTAQMIAMVLQTRSTTPGDVSGALSHMEPICARLCAAREDRATEVIPALRGALEVQEAESGDPARYNVNARRFHETLVERSGSETMILVIGALETIWSAHESTVWDEAVASPVMPGATAPGAEASGEGASADGATGADGLAGGEAPRAPIAERVRRAALRDHARLLRAIEAGDEKRAEAIASVHLAAIRRSPLATSVSGTHPTINASLVGGIDPARRQP
jgi:GntR family transcriptional regulator, transcriptional repressor for pyruvate dehydrogenase complex